MRSTKSKFALTLFGGINIGTGAQLLSFFLAPPAITILDSTGGSFSIAPKMASALWGGLLFIGIGFGLLMLAYFWDRQ